MKKLLVLVLILALGASAGASALTVGFSQVGANGDWRTANTIDLCNAVKAQGWTLVFADGQGIQQRQVDALREFIAQGVDYILFTCIVSTEWEDAINDVNDAGIPLILIDRFPDCADELGYAAHFVNDFVEQGRRMAYWMINYMDGAGRGGDEVRVAILEGIPGAFEQIGRTDGIAEVLSMPEYANYEVVASAPGNFTRSEGQSAMESILKSVDKIDVLLAQNDSMALGAIEAIQAAGLVPGQDIIIVGCGATKFALDAIMAGEMNATVECTPVYSPYIVEAIKNMEAGMVYDRAVIHPEEGCFDREGGVAYSEDGRLSVKAVDVIGGRLY